MRNVLISLSGPTAIGKTALAIALAQHFKTEILSADSRQFFAEMQIGTAVPNAAEMAAAPHHFIQHRSIFEDYSVGRYMEDAHLKLRELFVKHPVLILVGGSGLYIDAVTSGLDDFPDIDPDIRLELNTQFHDFGIEALQKQLKIKDPKYYNQVDLQNPQRLIRALEVCLGSGKPYSTFLGNRTTPNFFSHLPVGITAPRPVVYSRIETRVDQMMSQGLLEEARGLYPHRELNALRTVGYQELFSYFDKQCSLEKAVLNIKQNTRRFAKRQDTWFKRDPNIIWFSHETDSALIFNRIEKELNRLGNAQ
jgi:tRNA dimethylallyltransferase